jgi:hypothetical protein
MFRRKYVLVIRSPVDAPRQRDGSVPDRAAWVLLASRNWTSVRPHPQQRRHPVTAPIPADVTVNEAFCATRGVRTRQIIPNCPAIRIDHVVEMEPCDAAGP